MKAIVAYVPVIHEGYLNFFSRHDDVDQILILNDSFTNQYRSLEKDLRKLHPADCAALLKSLSLPAVVVGRGAHGNWVERFDEIVMPDEEISHLVAEELGIEGKVTFDNHFLRWTSSSAKAHLDVNADRVITEPNYKLKALIVELEKEAIKSPDQYRQVAAAACDSDGEIISIKYNFVVPTPETYFYEGDPRSQFKKGKGIDLGLTLHAEAAIIAEAASRDDLSLKGTSLFCTDFPCPPCAKLIAYSGVRTLYFLKGYAMLDGERILRDRGVEIVHIDV